MNDLLKFTIVITCVVLLAFIMSLCVHALSDTIKELLKEVITRKGKSSSKGGKKDDN